MPYRKRYFKRRPRRRRGNRLYRTRRAPNSALTRLTLRRGVGVPDRFTTTLQFCQRIKLDTAGSGTQVSKIYRGNSLFDPDFSVGGSQPNYFDQFAALYAHYFVWGSKIEVRALSAGASNDILCVVPARTQTPSSPIEVAIEQPRARWRVIGNAGHPYMIVNSARTKHMLPWKNSDQLALVTANPGDTWHWIVQANSIDGIEDAILDCVVKITYYATFYERQQQPQS